MVEEVHEVMKFIKWYPKGPIAIDDEVTGEGEKRNRIRKHDLIKFIAKDGGIRTVRAEDLLLL